MEMDMNARKYPSRRWTALFALAGITLVLMGAQVAAAQTGSDSTASLKQPPPPPPSQPKASRYGGIGGGWLRPSGSDFESVAGDGWAVSLYGYQFVNPTKKVAVGSEVGYQSFGEKNRVSVSNFPVDAVLRVFPSPEKRAKLFILGGLGFNYTKFEVSGASSTDYNFGTQAGAGVELRGSGPAALVVDATYHWVFDNPDLNFTALRASLLIPMMR
jgi:opacity protein-like surface antigen